jgi:hypothetical protein
MHVARLSCQLQLPIVGQVSLSLPGHVDHYTMSAYVGTGQQAPMHPM